MAKKTTRKPGPVLPDLPLAKGRPSKPGSAAHDNELVQVFEPPRVANLRDVPDALDQLAARVTAFGTAAAGVARPDDLAWYDFLEVLATDLGRTLSALAETLRTGAAPRLIHQPDDVELAPMLEQAALALLRSDLACADADVELLVAAAVELRRDAKARTTLPSGAESLAEFLARELVKRLDEDALRALTPLVLNDGAKVVQALLDADAAREGA